MKKLITFIILLGMLLGVSSLSEASTKKTQIFIGDVAPTSCVTGDGWIDTSNTNTPTLKFCTTVSPITFVSNDLTLGTTSGTAGRGDYANTAYNHSQNNTQAHTDYLTNNADDNMVGSLSISNNLTALGRTSLVDLSSTGYISTLALNTGLGLNELYGMDQNVKTTNAVTFATINTGYGAYELGQSNRTSDSQYVQNLTSTDTVFADDFESVTDAGILALDGDVTTSNDVTIGRNLSVDGNISGDRIYGVQWSDLNGTPADFADGTDANTTYTAGYGIVLDSTTFRINGNLTDDDVTLADVQAACSNDFHTIGGVDGGGDGGASLPINLSDDASVTGTLSNAHLPNNLTKSLDWDEITINMPAGFADGVDNTGGGTGGGDTIWAEDGAYVVLDITRSDSDVSLANNLYVAEKIYGDGSELSNLPIPDLDDLTVTSFAMTTNPADGFVMVSDGNGNGTWQYIGSTEISPSGVQVINGTTTAGDLSSLQTYDDTPYTVREASGASPLDVNVTFSGVTDISRLIIREYYLGSSSHHVLFQLWDWVESEWEDYWDIVGQDGYTVVTVPVLDPASHIGTGDNLGNVKLRLHHVQTGVSTHYLSLDFIQLVHGDFEGGSTNLAGYAKYNFSYNNFVGNGNFATEGNITTSSNITASNVFGTIQTASQPTIDHGSLAGKTDDDHTQYSLVDGSRANDFTGDVDIKGGSLSVSNNLTVVGKTYLGDVLLSGNVSIGNGLTVSSTGRLIPNITLLQTTAGNSTTGRLLKLKDRTTVVDDYELALYDSATTNADGLALLDDVGNNIFYINEAGRFVLGGIYDGGNDVIGAGTTVGGIILGTAAIYANEAGTAILNLCSDNFDDSSDIFSINELDSADLNMQVYDASGGSLINAITIKKYSTGRAGEVQLNYGATITGDLTNNGNLTITGVAKVDKIQSIVNTGWLGIDGDITTSNDVTVGRNLSVDGNIRGDFLYGNGAGISNIDWNNITANIPAGFSDGIDNEGSVALPIDLANDSSVTGILSVSHLSPTLTQDVVMTTTYPNLDTDSTDDIANAVDTNDGVQVTGNLSVSNDATVVNTFFANAIEFDSDVIDFQGSLSVASSLNTYGTIFGGQLGYINGFVLSASTSTTITIGPGSVHCKDKFFQMLSSTVDTISNYSNLNITYLYIDYSASTDSNIVFIDSTTAPTWSDAYLGWYNGDDRCYGALFCDSASTFMRFFSNGQNNDVSYLFGIVVLNLSTNMDPNAAWQAPDDYATSSVLPVNATAIYISLRNADSATGLSVYATNKESALNGVPGAGSQISCWGYHQVCVSQWITLGPSRDIVIAGADDDDNTLNCQYVGFRIRR